MDLIPATLTPQIIIKDHYLTGTTYQSGDKIPYGSQIIIEVRFPREVYADHGYGDLNKLFPVIWSDSSTGGSIFDSQGQNDTWNGQVEALVPANDDGNVVGK